MSQFLSIKEYIKYAEIVIKKWGLPFLVHDEDSVSDIAHALMKADERFNGFGDRTKYMLWCGKLRLRRIISNFKHKRKFQKLSNDIPENGMHHEDRLILSDFIDTAVDKGIISNDEHYCLISKYMYGKTLYEIGQELNITREWANKQIKCAIQKLKEFDDSN